MFNSPRFTGHISKVIERLPDEICDKCKKINHGDKFIYNHSLNICQQCATVLYFEPMERYWNQKREINRNDQQECQNCNCVPDKIINFFYFTQRFIETAGGNQEDSLLFATKFLCFRCFKSFYKINNQIDFL